MNKIINTKKGTMALSEIQKMKDKVFLLYHLRKYYKLPQYDI